MSRDPTLRDTIRRLLMGSARFTDFRRIKLGVGLPLKQEEHERPVNAEHARDFSSWQAFAPVAASLERLWDAAQKLGVKCIRLRGADDFAALFVESDVAIVYAHTLPGGRSLEMLDVQLPWDELVASAPLDYNAGFLDLVPCQAEQWVADRFRLRNMIVRAYEPNVEIIKEVKFHSQVLDRVVGGQAYPQAARAIEDENDRKRKGPRRES